MSPWHDDPPFGVFSNSAALTPTAASTLYTWVRAGAPRGPAAAPLTVAAPAPAAR